jgi:hypothetical protein
MLPSSGSAGHLAGCTQAFGHVTSVEGKVQRCVGGELTQGAYWQVGTYRVESRRSSQGHFA